MSTSIGHLTFTPYVSPDVLGITVGLGMGLASTHVAPVDLAHLSPAEQAWAGDRDRVAETLAAKRALLNALNLDGNAPDLLKQVEVRLDGPRVCVKAHGAVLDRAWRLHAIDYKAAFVKSSDEVICTAIAVADVRDISKD